MYLVYFDRRHTDARSLATPMRGTRGVEILLYVGRVSKRTCGLPGPGAEDAPPPFDRNVLLYRSDRAVFCAPRFYGTDPVGGRTRA